MHLAIVRLPRRTLAEHGPVQYRMNSAPSRDHHGRDIALKFRAFFASSRDAREPTGS